MTTALGYQCEVSAKTPFRHFKRVLVLNMSISDCLPPGCAGEHSALKQPYVTLDAGQYTQSIALSPLDGEKPKWQAITSVLVNSVRCPREFSVTSWHRSDAKYVEAFKLADWDVEVSFKPTVSHQMSSGSS